MTNGTNSKYPSSCNNDTAPVERKAQQSTATSTTTSKATSQARATSSTENQNNQRKESNKNNKKQIPLNCLKNIPGFRQDADVTHIVIRYSRPDPSAPPSSKSTPVAPSSQAFTIHRGTSDDEFIVSGMLEDHHASHAGAGRNNSTMTMQNPHILENLQECVIDISPTLPQHFNGNTRRERIHLPHYLTSLFQHQNSNIQRPPCPQHIRNFLSQYDYLPPSFENNRINSTSNTANNIDPKLSPIVYSFSHSQGFLLLAAHDIDTDHAIQSLQSDPSLSSHPSHSPLPSFPSLVPLLLQHNISTQFLIPSSTDISCFGEPFVQKIIFHLVGLDTVILNWILGLQRGLELEVKREQRGGRERRETMDRRETKQNGQTTVSTVSTARAVDTKRPRFVYHWKSKKELDLDLLRNDQYSFHSAADGLDGADGADGSDGSDGADGTPHSDTNNTNNYTLPNLPNLYLRIIHRITHRISHRLTQLQQILHFLTSKLFVLLSTLFLFFLTTSLVSFTFQETQDRMLEFTLQLRRRVRGRMPLGGLIVGHVMENLVFVPIMVGMVFFLIEYYGGDKFLAFVVLSMVWVCEVFSAISIRSIQGMHFFPRVFFLYFTLFHVYFFSCPVGFTYASLASTCLFLLHTMLFFWNRYELPALHGGWITPMSPRMVQTRSTRTGAGVAGVAGGGTSGEAPGLPPPQLPISLAPSQRERQRNTQHTQPFSQGPPPIPHVTDDQTLTTVASSFDYTPQSNQIPLAPPSSANSTNYTHHTHHTQHTPYTTPMRTYVAAASSSLQSMQSLTSIQSLTSLAERASSPNWLFHGGLGMPGSTGSGGGGGGNGEDDDSYLNYVGDERRSSLSIGLDRLQQNPQSSTDRSSNVATLSS